MIPLDETTARNVRRLPRRQLETLTYLAKGFTHSEIAALMGISHGTVGDQCKSIYQTLQIDNKVEAAVIACKYGLV